MYSMAPLFHIPITGLLRLRYHFKGKVKNNFPVQSDRSLIRSEPLDGPTLDIDEFSIDLVSFLVQDGSQVDIGNRSEQFVPGTRLGRNADFQLFDGLGHFGGLPNDLFLLMEIGR